MSANDIFVMTFHKMTPRELITWCLGTAALQEKHPFHASTMPDWVHGPRHFREHATNLTELEKAAENRDTAQMKKRDEEQQAIYHSIDVNSSYIVLRAKAANDDSLLHGMGYEVKGKEKGKRSHQHIPVSRLPLKLEVERAGDAAVRLRIQRDPGAGAYQVQYCKGEPTGEDSWADYGNFRSIRPLLKNLDRASWYYFRVRSHGDNETSPWSAVVAIIVT